MTPLGHGEYLSTRRFPALDGLRAIAVLLVFTAHPADRTLWAPLHGSTGVTLFFVLSGFLITTLLLREEARYGRVSFRGFYLRRLFRIYPMYFAVLALYCVLILGLGFQADRRNAFVDNVPWMVLLVPEHAMFAAPAGVQVPFNGSWSIGIEEKFYLVWPLLAFLALTRFRRGRLPVAAGLAAVLLVVSLVDPGLGFVNPYVHLLLGVLVALLLHAPEHYRRLSWLGRPPVLLVAGVVVLAAQLSTDRIELGAGNLYGLHGVLLALLLAGLVTTRTRAIAWLSSRPMVHLGALSYVLYLIHNFFLNAAEAVLPSGWGAPGSLLSTSVGIAAAVGVAHLLHRFYEEPARRLGVRLSRRIARGPAVAGGPATLAPLAPGADDGGASTEGEPSRAQRATS